MLPIDRIIVKKANQENKNAIALEDATNVVPKKNSLRKVLIIGGITSGASAGALAYLILNSGSKSGSQNDHEINGKPPPHP